MLQTFHTQLLISFMSVIEAFVMNEVVLSKVKKIKQNSYVPASPHCLFRHRSPEVISNDARIFVILIVMKRGVTNEIDQIEKLVSQNHPILLPRLFLPPGPTTETLKDQELLHFWFFVCWTTRVDFHR